MILPEPKDIQDSINEDEEFLRIERENKLRQSSNTSSNLV
jgi:hypothetical protein